MKYEVINADCMPVLAGMPSRSFDAVVTDIPYDEVSRESGGLRDLDKGAADVLDVPLPDLVAEFARVASGWVYVFCGTRQVSRLLELFGACGLSERFGVWHKTDPPPLNGEHTWMSALEVCAIGRHPRAWFGEHCAPAYWHGPRARGPEWHPTPKPVWLMDRIIAASVPPGGRVLDPFAGSGATGVAAVTQGRGLSVTLIERNPEWAGLMRKRLDGLSLNLFDAVA